jgi:hypothetical protein
MVPMRPGRRLALPGCVLAVLASTTLTGCGLLDTGSDVDEAFEYLPADTFQVLFTEGGVADDLDTSELGRYAQVMEDAPFNDGDIEWEAQAAWGDPGDAERTAAVWKVDDDTDLDALAEDLEAQGYDKDTVDGRSFFSVELSAAEDGAIGGTYPVPLLLNVLIDEDEQVVAGASDTAPLEDVAAVISDDDDSLADDDGFDDLLDAADDDPDIAWLTSDGFAVCVSTDRSLTEDRRDDYEDLGRPEARALFVSGDDADVRLALQYDSEDAATDDLEARETLVDDGVDPVTREPFDDLGDFELEQDGDLLLIDEDFDGGARAAIQAERKGGGPGVCGPAAAG